MKRMKILIVEDKGFLSDQMANIVLNLGYEVCGIAVSADEALKILEASTPDLILMDIKLEGEVDGVELAEMINVRQTTPVIYLTEFNDPATVKRVKEIHPAIFLSKPFNELDLRINIELALEHGNNLLGKNSYLVKDAIFIHEKESKIKVPFREILFIKAERSYCTITTKKKVYTLSINMAQVSRSLSDPPFSQVHRSYVVNFDHLHSISRHSLVVGSHTIPIGGKYGTAILNRLNIT